jgi:hypothetical protein
VRHGIRAISPWRDQVHAIGLERTTTLVREHRLELSGYCRGGMFPAMDAEGRRRALDDNRSAIDEARTLDAACLVLVVGSLPGALEGRPQSKNLFAARSDVHDGIAATLEHTRAAGMPLAIEPLHPMYAADRACVNTLEQALDLCEAIDPNAAGTPGAGSRGIAALGVAVDVYHVWWDPKLERRSRARGLDQPLAFRPDWLVPTRDPLNDRGMGAAAQPRRAHEALDGRRERHRPRGDAGRRAAAPVRLQGAGGRGARHLHHAPPQRGLTAHPALRQLQARAPCDGPGAR